MTILPYLSKIENLVKNTENVNKTNGKASTFHKTLNLDNSLSKAKIKTFCFHVLRWTSFLMIPLTTLYDDYIDRPKLTDQENPFDYIVPPPTKVGGNNKLGFKRSSIILNF